MRRVVFLLSVALLSGLVLSAVSWAAPRGKVSRQGTLARSLQKPAATAQADAKKPVDLAGFMQLKLDHAEKVLEGIALEDYEMIAVNAQKMVLLAEDEAWQVYQTADYAQHSADFRRIGTALTKAAKAKNIDGAALAYMQMTMCCVNCHKYTRDVRMASR